MKFPRTYELQEIADLIDCEYVGRADFPVNGMNEIHGVASGEIVFVDHPKYYDKALESSASVVLINKEVECPEGKALLLSDDPFRDFNKLATHFRPFIAFAKADKSEQKIGENTVIEPGVHLGKKVSIGNNCIIHAGVIINDHVIIGNNVEIHSGTILGADAFYYKRRPDGYDKLKSCGRVIVEDHVEIGAACTIDRGVTGDTRIGHGSKLDNQVHVGHDTILGKHVLIASQTGISGCVVVEDDVTIWGQAGITSGISITKGTVIAAKSGVSKSITKAQTVAGTPAMDIKQKYREMAALRQLPDLLKKKS